MINIKTDYKEENTKGITGKLYNAIVSVKEASTDYVRKRWEKDMRVEIPKEARMQAWKSQCSTTNSLTWRTSVGSR